MEKDIREYMLTKPGIMRRSPEKQQKYVDDKLAKLALEFDKKHNISTSGFHFLNI